MQPRAAEADRQQVLRQENRPHECRPTLHNVILGREDAGGDTGPSMKKVHPDGKGPLSFEPDGGKIRTGIVR
jgi:hypothetical protein